MAHFTETCYAAAVRPTRFSLSAILRVWKQRQDLKNLDDHMLADIGVSYRDAFAEAHKPVWDVPNTWRA